jgi:hypothetical protein
MNPSSEYTKPAKSAPAALTLDQVLAKDNVVLWTTQFRETDFLVLRLISNLE